MQTHWLSDVAQIVKKPHLTEYFKAALSANLPALRICLVKDNWSFLLTFIKFEFLNDNIENIGWVSEAKV